MAKSGQQKGRERGQSRVQSSQFGQCQQASPAWLLAGWIPAQAAGRDQPPCRVEMKVTLSPSRTSASSSPLQHGTKRQKTTILRCRAGPGSQAGRSRATRLHVRLHMRGMGARAPCAGTRRASLALTLGQHCSSPSCTTVGCSPKLPVSVIHQHQYAGPPAQRQVARARKSGVLQQRQKGGRLKPQDAGRNRLCSAVQHPRPLTRCCPS